MTTTEQTLEATLAALLERVAKLENETLEDQAGARPEIARLRGNGDNWRARRC